jgi:predicted signal transduction protein with EAL and GGDEF domain
MGRLQSATFTRHGAPPCRSAASSISTNQNISLWVPDIRNATVVRAAVRLARELGIGCIAEGVETKAQADFLMASGCDAAQGYFFGMPISAERMTLRLQQDSPARRAPPKLTVVAG